MSAAPWGSASILPISMMYIDMMGGEGLTLRDEDRDPQRELHRQAPRRALPGAVQGRDGTVAHECIVDPRALKASAGIEVEDIAKRLMDYGFHAPTVSFPVAGTLMIEPTESESKAELDRFCDALIAIREEIREIESGIADRADNPLKHAPHPLARVLSDTWESRLRPREAAFPAPWTRSSKFWPAVGRVESAYGDRNLVCSCLPTDAYAEAVLERVRTTGTWTARRARSPGVVCCPLASQCYARRCASYASAFISASLSAGFFRRSFTIQPSPYGRRVDERRLLVEAVVHLDDLAGERRVQLGDGLHRFDGAEDVVLAEARRRPSGSSMKTMSPSSPCA